MTKEKLERAIEIKETLEETERAIKTLKNSMAFQIDCFNGSNENGSIYDIPLEIVDFAIDWYIKFKEKLEKEFEEL